MQMDAKATQSWVRMATVREEMYTPPEESEVYNSSYLRLRVTDFSHSVHWLGWVYNSKRKIGCDCLWRSLGLGFIDDQGDFISKVFTNLKSEPRFVDGDSENDSLGLPSGCSSQVHIWTECGRGLRLLWVTSGIKSSRKTRLSKWWMNEPEEMHRDYHHDELLEEAQ